MLTPILAKILEHILLARDEHLILSKQSNMQIGFTAGTSPAWGSLMFTEAICCCSRHYESLQYCMAQIVTEEAVHSEHR